MTASQVRSVAGVRIFSQFRDLVPIACPAELEDISDEVQYRLVVRRGVTVWFQGNAVRFLMWNGALGALSC